MRGHARKLAHEADACTTYEIEEMMNSQLIGCEVEIDCAVNLHPHVELDDSCP
jgi:hypothetical protein